MRYKLLLLLMMLTVLPGCLTRYVQEADTTAYRTISRGWQNVFASSEDFDVAYQPVVRYDDTQMQLDGQTIELYDKDDQPLSLDDALAIAFRSSRTYQNRKEDLYREALFVANEGRSWHLPIFTGPTDALAEWQRPQGPGSSTTQLIEANAELSLAQRFIHGGIFTVGVALDMATDLLGSQTLSVGSLIDANFTQPLLRGGWRGFAYEDQYRLERDFAISIYQFERYRQTFVVDIVTAYYNVLRQRDRLENEVENIKRLEETRNLTQVLAEGGQVSRIQLDQADQNLLNARIRLESERQRYQNLLDQFKITLGLPVQVKLAPVYPQALQVLQRFQPSVMDIPFDEATAIDLAMNTRPDVLVERAALRDAQRDVDIAADQFLPKLDLEVGIAAGNATGSRDPWRIRWDEHQRYARLRFDYNLDQTDNRDAYRGAMLDVAQARRDWQQFADEVRLDVRQSLRDLERSRQTYQLQLMNVQIARRRRMLASQQQKEGEASARDVLEAEQALLETQNGLTGALIDYTTTRLRFLATLGMLQVKDQGQYDERNQPQTAERIQQRYPYTAPSQQSGPGDASP